MENLLWFSWDTIITDILAGFGFLLIIITPFIFGSIQRSVLNGRLHTRIDGEKLFEKLKYDLKLSSMTGINKKLLYRDVNYAISIFSGAMEYNKRDLLWYFNELYAKNFILKEISTKSWLHFLVWVVTIGTMVGGSYLDFAQWIFQISTMTEYSGIVSISVLHFIAVSLCAIIKFAEYRRIKVVVNDEIRQINLAKKEKVWKDYRIVYFASIGVFFLGWLFIFINMFF